MITVSEIREQLVDLLAEYNDDSAARFEEWLAGASWNMHMDSGPLAQQLVGNIELRFAEADQRSNYDAWLKAQLATLLSEVPVLSEPKESVQIRASSSTDFKNLREWAFSSAGKSRAEAFASSVHR
jgi:hypothetical protein